MYNQPYQPSFGQPVQSQYRGNQRAFQPTGYVQSFYQQQQQQQPSAFAGNMQAQNYHTSNYVGNKQDHDAYLREDSMSPHGYGAARGQMQSQNQGQFANVPSQQFSQNLQSSNPASYHTQNYVGDRRDHDANLREDSLRASSYGMGRSQGMGTLSNVQGQYNVNVPTNQMGMGSSQSAQFRNF